MEAASSLSVLLPQVRAWLVAPALQDIQRQAGQPIAGRDRTGAADRPAAAGRGASIEPISAFRPRPRLGFFCVMAPLQPATSSSRRIISPASARYASAPRDSLSCSSTGLAERGRLGQAHIARNDGPEHLVAEMHDQLRRRLHWTGCCAGRTWCAAIPSISSCGLTAARICSTVASSPEGPRARSTRIASGSARCRPRPAH